MNRRRAWSFVLSYLAALAVLGLWFLAWLGLDFVEGLIR